ncbi:dTMP kinase [Kitasatospora arboriphila]
MAGVASLGLLTALEHRAARSATAWSSSPRASPRPRRPAHPGHPALVLPPRLLTLALLVEGVALILAGLVLDFVLVLLLTVLVGVAAGLTVSVGRTLLAQEVEEARLPKVTEHLYAVLRAVVGSALIAVPLIAAAYGEVTLGRVEPGSFTFIHDGAALAVSTAACSPWCWPRSCCCAPTTAAGSRRSARSCSGPSAAPPSRPRTAPPAPASSSPWRAATAAGKSTQAQALAEWIRAKGHEVVLTREPGGSPVGQRLRGLVLDVGNTGLSHRAEALIYAADRAEHVESVIRPALARGAVVITDRYMDSSIAYQGAAATSPRPRSPGSPAGPPAASSRTSPWCWTSTRPPPGSGSPRRWTAWSPSRPSSTPGSGGFLALAAADPSRYLVVDAAQQPAQVTTAIRHRLDRELPLSEQEKAARVEQERLAREAAERRAAEEARLKAEAEEAERKRQALLEELRAEQAEKERLAMLEAERIAAEEARKAAEEARLRAEEQAKERAEEEARRQAAEEARLKAEAAERERREAEAAAQAEIQRQLDVQRAEQRRRAEEALQRAEEARLQAEAAEQERREAEAAAASAATTAELPQVAADRDGDGTDAEDAETTREIPEVERRKAVRAAGQAAPRTGRPSCRPSPRPTRPPCCRRPGVPTSGSRRSATRPRCCRRPTRRPCCRRRSAPTSARHRSRTRRPCCRRRTRPPCCRRPTRTRPTGCRRGCGARSRPPRPPASSPRSTGRARPGPRRRRWTTSRASPTACWAPATSGPAGSPRRTARRARRARSGAAGAASAAGTEPCAGGRRRPPTGGGRTGRAPRSERLRCPFFASAASRGSPYP